MLKSKTKLTPRQRRLWDNFHLTEKMWQAIYDYQKGLCAICKKLMRKPNVDHQHAGDEAGLIRGLLCPACNRALGRFRDSLILLQSAVEYLLHPPATTALGEPHYGLPGRVNTKKSRKLAKKFKKQQKLLDNLT